MTRSIAGSHVLVTGGTGSFGHRVARALVGRGTKEITVFSRDEDKQTAMKRKYPDFRYVVGDVRDSRSIRNALRGVDLVFHAAALKQVPHCESWPSQALRTNAFGSENVFQAAMDRGVRAVIALSTDKAVKPVNAMGLSKALMEKLLQEHAAKRSETTFACVRYGNVMGSRGSVIPVFREQIAAGGPITLTVPSMTRFLLTLGEAVDLVFHALEHAASGDTFVRKAPACTVDLLARAMIERYANGPIALRVIGPRVGEKLHETLVNEYEMLRAVEGAEHYRIRMAVEGDVVDWDGRSMTEYSSDVTERIESVQVLKELLARSDADSEVR